MLKRYTCLFLFMCCAAHTFGQNALPIGRWRSHLPYQAGPSVTQSSDKVYYATEYSVLLLEKEEQSTQFLTRVEGLSNSGIIRVKYNQFSETLIVVYGNGVIDLVRPRGIVTMNQIRNFANFIGDKIINDIYVENDSIIYVAANYGISKINIRRAEFVFTTFTGIDVNQVIIHEGRLHAATAEGLYAIAADAFSPENFNDWRWLGPEEGFPGDYSARALGVFQGVFFAGINDTLMRIDASGPTRVHYEPSFRVQFLSSEGAHLLAGFRCATPGCFGARLWYFDAEGKGREISRACLGDTRHAIEDERGRVWFADGFRFFRMLGSVESDFCNLITINSPVSVNVRQLVAHERQLWLAAGGLTPQFSNVFMSDGFASFIDGQWTIYNPETRIELRGENPDNPNDNLLDIITIAVHPQNNTVYAGSYFEGLAELTPDGHIRVYNSRNSSLGRAVGDPTRTRVSGLAFDSERNLWVSNFLAEKPLSVLKKDGSWQNFDLACRQQELHQIVVDRNNFKWAAAASPQAGLIVFDEGNMDTPADDRCRVITALNSNLPNNSVNCLAVDLNGDVWAGTSEGIVIFECGASAFEPVCQGSRRVVEVDENIDFLLATEDVQTIAVDGANRKWVGTRNGVFLISPAGTEELGRFTTANSPLPDNNVLAIAVSPLTGEVFIGTARGLVSYQSEAVEGGRVHRSEITVFPNPVRPDYQGPIAIKGLARDANVKITDVNGRLVFETRALGGQAIWDGLDYNGRRPATGVYLVFSATNPRFDGFIARPDAAQARILFVN
jgi:hypothetical protein